MLPLVSIIIPVHNAADSLAEAVRSAHRATMHPHEIILVESGSSDASPAICASLLCPFDRILHATRPGASAARNLGLEAAQGTWIQYLDADDWLEPLAIDRKIEALREPFEIAVGTRRERSTEGRILGDRSPHIYAPTAPVDCLLRLWWGEKHLSPMVQTGQWLLSRELAARSGRWNEGLIVNNDGEYFARAVLAASRVVPVPASIAGWQRQPTGQSLSTRQDAAALTARLRSWELSFAHLLKAHPEVVTDPRFRRALAAQFSELLLAAEPQAPGVAHAARQRLHVERLKWQPSPTLSPQARLACSLFGVRGYRRLSRWRHSRR